MMAYVALTLKIVLCVSAFVTAFLGVFRRTIDEQKRLTSHGKVCVVCVFVTFNIGVGNELLNLRKTALDKRTTDDAAMVMRVKLDQALDEGRKRGEEAKSYMIESDNARKKLEAVQTQLNDINVLVTDPTIKRMLGDVRRLAGSDITLTGEKLMSVQKVLIDVHDDLADVRMIVVESREAVRNARNELGTVKLEIDGLKTDMLHVQSLVTPPPSSPRPRSDPDAGFLDSGTFFTDGEKLDAN